MFDQIFDPANSSIVTNLIPATATEGTHTEVVELSRGTSNGRLFYNFLDRSIMIKGEFRSQGSNTRDASNTYNFTVSPKG